MDGHLKPQTGKHQTILASTDLFIYMPHTHHHWQQILLIWGDYHSQKALQKIHIHENENWEQLVM